MIVALGDTLLVYFAVTDTEFGKDFNVQQLLDDFKFHFRDLFERGDIESAKSKGTCHKGSQDFLTNLLSKYGTSKLRVLTRHQHSTAAVLTFL
jgi:hypothetical protein